VHHDRFIWLVRDPIAHIIFDKLKTLQPSLFIFSSFLINIATSGAILFRGDRVLVKSKVVLILLTLSTSLFSFVSPKTKLL